MKKIRNTADLADLPRPYQLQGADLRGANLLRADLQRADLQRADLQGADLQGADLQEVFLHGADLCEANLAGATLEGATLRGANLQGSNLQGADLWRANLRGANLRGANLRGANLRGANLSEANLEGVDLSEANLEAAYLAGASLEGVKFPEFLVKLPPVGESFIGWKKVRGNVVLKLEIPAESPRVSTFIGTKCRAKRVKVLEAFDRLGSSVQETEFRSLHDHAFVYRIGEVVEVLDFDDDILAVCTRGIHFFVEREEAEKYTL